MLTWHKVGVKYNKLTICGPGFFLTAKEDFEKKNLEKAGKGSEKPAVTWVLRETLSYIKILDKELTSSQNCVQHYFQIEDLTQPKNKISFTKFNQSYWTGIIKRKDWETLLVG